MSQTHPKLEIRKITNDKKLKTKKKYHTKIWSPQQHFYIQCCKEHLSCHHGTFVITMEKQEHTQHVSHVSGKAEHFNDNDYYKTE